MRIDDPFYNDQPMIFIVYYKYCIIALYTIKIVSLGMMPFNNMDIQWISMSSNTPGHYGMAGHIGLGQPFYNDGPNILVVYYKSTIIVMYTTGLGEPFYNDRSNILVVYYKSTIIAMYKTSIVCWWKIRCITMRTYSISWSFKASGQFEMAGQMGIVEPFYNDRPLILPDYYKYAIIALYPTSIVYLGIVRCITMLIYSIPWSFKTSSQSGMAGQIGMKESFYNDRHMILLDCYKYNIVALHTINTVCGANMPCKSMTYDGNPGD